MDQAEYVRRLIHKVETVVVNDVEFVLKYPTREEVHKIYEKIKDQTEYSTLYSWKELREMKSDALHACCKEAFPTVEDAFTFLRLFGSDETEIRPLVGKALEMCDIHGLSGDDNDAPAPTKEQVEAMAEDAAHKDFLSVDGQEAR